MGKTVKYLDSITISELDELQIDIRKNGTNYAYAVDRDIVIDDHLWIRINQTADVTFEVWPDAIHNIKCRYNQNGKYMTTTNIFSQLAECILSVDN